MVQIPDPIVITLVFELEEEKRPIEKFLLLASIVPLVRVTVLVLPTTALSASCHVPPTPLNVSGLSMVTELEVMVLVPDVADIVMALAPPVTVIPVPIVKLPARVIAEEAHAPV
jgi:hypothetical protein